MREIVKSKSSGGFCSLGEILDLHLNRIGLSDRLLERQAILRWDEIVGKELAGHTKASRIHNHCLIVKVDSPILRNELTFLKPGLLEKMESLVPESAIEDIKFR